MAAVLVIFVGVLGYRLNHRHDHPLPPIIHTADSVIATRPHDSTTIAKYRDVDSTHAGRAAAVVSHLHATDTSAALLEAQADRLRLAAAHATLLQDKVELLTAALDTSHAAIDTLHKGVAQRDSIIGEQRVQLTAKEDAFQVSDRRRRELEPLVVGLRDSLVKALKPPSRFHWFGITCGGAGISHGVGIGCSVGPTFTP